MDTSTYIDIGAEEWCEQFYRSDLNTPLTTWMHRNFFDKIYSNVPVRTLKLNMDDSWYESKEKGAFGGGLKIREGKWLLGYCDKFTCTSSLEAKKIWANY
ncbi:hypothetical protein RHGRI_030842 [Rhododendron griersonianum]|uniref:Uncharacterized protein n=1 Tax=Rhododendron griersonianum TaxID=479676 RepID=A0AAV6I9D8_9ERIC|nr:hypothetical protein RHGRI_030842 [Rhododendron griersonianum]